MDALLPIARGVRAYEAAMLASRHDRDEAGEGDEHRRMQYRLYEVQNGNHIETFKNVFPALELSEPHAQRAFDLLVDHVENRASLPPSQCIPRGGAIAVSPTTPGHCSSPFVA